MRINLTKKEIINSIYMQLGFSKNISENLLEDFLSILLEEIIINKKVKIPKFGTFILRYKKKRIGRNPKTLESKVISERNVVLFKVSKDLKVTELEKKYKTIGEVAQILKLVNKKNGKLSTHTIRFWEKEFKQIKPHIFSGNRRYYDDNSIEILKKIHFLLKNKGMTIKGVKNELLEYKSDVDEQNNKTINAVNIKTKLTKISKLIKNIKKNG